MDWKTQVYDILVIEFVGLTTILAFALLYQIQPPAILAGDGAVALALWVVGAYATGHFIRGLSRWLFGLVERKRPSRAAWFELSNEEREAIVDGLKEFYGMATVPLDRIEPLCIAAAQERLSKRDIFIAVADYSRSMALLFLVIAGFTFVRMLFKSGSPLISVCFGLGSCIFFGSYRTYTRYGAMVAYGGFLAWWRILKAKSPDR